MNELIKRLRDRSGAFDYDGRPDIACDYEQAADAIEKLSAYTELYKDLAEKNQQMARKLIEEKPCWIPVTERLPEHDTNCIVFSGGEVKEAHFYYGKFYDPIEDYMRYNATHWMPLPEPPKEET